MEQQLHELKLHQRESYADVNPPASCAEDTVPLSDEEIAVIKEAFDDIKAGRVKFSYNLRHELGL